MFSIFFVTFSFSFSAKKSFLFPKNNLKNYLGRKNLQDSKCIFLVLLYSSSSMIHIFEEKTECNTVKKLTKFAIFSQPLHIKHWKKIRFPFVWIFFAQEWTHLNKFSPSKSLNQKQSFRQMWKRIKHELYEKKAYIKKTNIYKVSRHQFLTRYGLQPLPGNYSGDKIYAKSNWLCKCPEEREEELQVMSGKCKVYGDLPQMFWDLATMSTWWNCLLGF